MKRTLIIGAAALALALISAAARAQFNGCGFGFCNPSASTAAAPGPTVTITTAGGATSNASQAIAGTVVETGVYLGANALVYNNGSLVSTTAVTAGAFSTSITLSVGANSITATNTDGLGNTGTSAPVVFTYTLPVATPFELAVATAANNAAGDALNSQPGFIYPNVNTPYVRAVSTLVAMSLFGSY